MALLAHWTFENHLNDISGNGKHLTSVGNITFPDGVKGKCLDLADDQSSYVYNSTGVTVSKLSGTIMFWINFDDLSVSQDIFGINSVNGYISLMEYQTNGVFTTETLNNCNSFNSPSFSPLQVGTWYHIAVVFNNNLAYWYKDGNYLGTPSSYGINNCAGPTVYEMLDNVRITHIGAGAYSGNFKGKFDDFRVYDNAFTEEDIKSLITHGSSIESNGNFISEEFDEASDPEPAILDYTTWTENASSATGFSRNGSSTENIIIYDQGPFAETLVWESRPDLDDANNFDCGGWNTPTFPVDETKMYRFTVWVRNTGTVNSGNFYHGLHGYPDPVLAIANNVPNSNPYFDCPGIGSIPSDWILSVGHVWPSGTTTTSTHPDTGRWSLAGIKLSTGGCNVAGVDSKWAVGTTSGNERVYHFYSYYRDAHLQFAFPRVEIVDGTEPTIQQLINNYKGILPTSVALGEMDETTGTTESQAAQIKDGKIFINGEFIEE